MVDPIRVFTDAVDAMRTNDWERVASCCDPVSLATFKREFVDRFHPTRVIERPRHMTAEDYMRHDASLPLEVAEYYASRAAISQDPMNRLEQELPGVSDFTELEKLTPAQVFATWLRGRSLYQFEHQIAKGSISPDVAETALVEAGAVQRVTALGFVPDGEELAYVVFRDERFAATFHQPEQAAFLERLPDEERALVVQTAAGLPRVITCRKQADGSWKLVAGYDFITESALGWFGYAVAEDAYADGGLTEG